MTQHEGPGGLSELATMLHEAQLHPADLPPTPGQEAARKRRRRNGRIIGIIVAAVLVALASTYVTLTLTAPVGATAASIRRPHIVQPAAATIALPKEGEAAISVSGAGDYLGTSADGIFASSGGDAALPMASISKLVTAMVILNAKPLGTSGNGPTITWSSDDAKLYDKYYLLNATIAAMPANSTMSEHDALETMLVVSACNYAEAMADWAFGSENNFLYATRKWLAANGLTGTVMVEPTGIDAHNVSTPSDLIALGKLAMANPVIASIVDKTSLDVPSLAGMPNTNDILGTDGIDGIKTGTLGGSDLLFSAVVSPGTPKPLTITGVVLGGATRASVDSDVEALIMSVVSGFHETALSTRGQLVGSYATPWGSKASIQLQKYAAIFSWSNTPITSSVSTTTLKTGASGERVGTVTWTAGKTTVTVPVVLKGRIQPPSTWWRLTHPAQILGK